MRTFHSRQHLCSQLHSSRLSNARATTTQTQAQAQHRVGALCPMPSCLGIGGHTGGSRQGHPRYTSAQTVGRPWVSRPHCTMTQHKDASPRCYPRMVAEHGCRPTITVHSHCNSTPRATSTTDPEKIEAQPNSFVKTNGVHVEEEPENPVQLDKLTYDKMLQQTPTIQQVRKTVEVPEVQFDQILDVSLPQTIEKLMDLNSAIEQLNTAVCRGEVRLPRRRSRRRKSVCSAGTQLTSDRDFANTELSTAMEHTLRGVRRETQS